nr:hypothetical protein K03E5.5 - Caenorhabditis elegans [Caenorhabditis elegans]
MQVGRKVSRLFSFYLLSFLSFLNCLELWWHRKTTAFNSANQIRLAKHHLNRAYFLTTFTLFRRWSSVGSGASPSASISRSTPTATNVLSSGVEPSTVGTSWNSVRWNKPSTSYRANLASRFENNSTANSNSSYTPQRTSRFLSSAAKNAADLASIGPSVSSRASRFDTTNMANKEKYRNEARDLINKWSSRERNSNSKCKLFFSVFC